MTLNSCHPHNLFTDTIYMSQTKPTHTRMQVRIPSEVHTALLAACEESDRSLNGEIVNLRSTFKGKRARQLSGDRISIANLHEQPRERQLAAQQPSK